VNRSSIRILLVADTHLGFDLPFRPRIQRRRRGPDFFENFKRALQPAQRGEVDLVVHGGDLFYRSRIADALVDMAFAPLIEVAERGIPVYLVPGNHERSRIPLHLWSAHPKLNIFTEPMTFVEEIEGIKLTLAGFPFKRNIRDHFTDLITETGYENHKGDIRILCMHQTVEGAQVGPSNYTFRSGPDIIRGADIPSDFAMILSGHIHRAQLLSSDLRGRNLSAPVIYPGSVERTSFAERKEEKQYVIVESAKDASPKGLFQKASFHSLPTRPMLTIRAEVDGVSAKDVQEYLSQRISEAPEDAVVRVQPVGKISEEVEKIIAAQYLRTLVPDTMNISVSIPRIRNKISERS
jgi:DNA repair exonuclease SbcCD nuclease subunit